MPELLLELGCEELPASFVHRAFVDLQAQITHRLGEARISHGEAGSLGTPRRLIVQVQDVADRQEDVVKEQRGPAAKAAFDAEGKPTKALEGFCRSQGAAVDELRLIDDYVWISKAVKGEPTKDVLKALLPQAIAALQFDKGMRWGGGRFRFARPIRWILAAFGGELVPFEIGAIESALTSRGHRFTPGGPFEASSFDQLVSELRRRSVEPDPGMREQAIRAQIAEIASDNPEIPGELIDENVYLTEWPVAIECEFKKEFLELPAPVLVTSMVKHEKFFPERDAGGKLTNRFISIRNGGEDATVRRGNAWVLNARFNDAKFFYDEDRKHSLDHFLDKTKGIVFQDKLGTVHQRAFRLSELAFDVAQRTGANGEEAADAKQAGLYAKADLSTGLVSELPGLQGLIGAEYARLESKSDTVCWAIATHYDVSKNTKIDCAGARTSARLTIADQCDKLAGYLGIGLMPSGSSDPFALRRAATVLIELALRWPKRFPNFRETFERAQEIYRAQGFEVEEALRPLRELFRSRYDSIFAGSRPDLIEAAILDDYVGEPDELDPQGVRFRLQALELAAMDVPFVQTATRPQNIVAAAVNKGIGFRFHEPLDDESDIQSQTGSELRQAARKLGPAIQDSADREDAKGLLTHLKTLEAPINSFFETTMVMVDEEKIRSSRLTLLHGVHLLLRRAGDFSKVVIAGD